VTGNTPSSGLEVVERRATTGPERPSLLFVHGLGHGAWCWEHWQSAAADAGYSSSAVSLRGHGGSPGRLRTSRLGQYADDVIEVAMSLPAPPVIVGHSMGGLVAMRMALDGGAARRGLVLVDTGPELSEKGVGIVHNFVANNVEFDDLDEFLDNVVKYDKFRKREHIARTVKYNMLRRADGKYVSKVDKRRFGDPSGRRVGLDDVKGIDGPVLLVRGGESEVLEPEAAERFVAALPEGRLVTVGGAGHNVHSANTVGFLEVVTPFLADLG
jgi:pimeloyl-ACP methyl ester carboxylesterase